MLTSSEKLILEWLQKGDGQYGECHGKTLDGLIERGFVAVQGADTGLVNGFIAKGADIMFRAVSITDAGRKALTPQRWEVRTRVTLMRYYYVEAEDRKSAETASCEASCDHEEEENEETMEITEIVDEASSVPSTMRVCAKCGCETKGEEALVSGEIWCHPCADDVSPPPAKLGSEAPCGCRACRAERGELDNYSTVSSQERL